MVKSIVFALTLVAGVASAQTAGDTLVAGASLRVWSPELPRRPWAATLRAAREDSLVLKALGRQGRGADSLRSVGRGSITRLEVLTRRSRPQGALLLGAIGALGAVGTSRALSALAGDASATYYPNGTDQPGMPLWLAMATEAAIGGAAGAIAGALFPGSYWRRLVP